MTFHPTMKRRLHERLHSLIGEEEADALLDEISPPDPITRDWLEDRFVTKDWLEDRFVTKDWLEDRFVTKDWLEDRFVTKEHLDLRLEGLEGRLRGEMGELRGELRGEIGALDAKMSERFRQHTYFMVGAASLVGLVSGIVQAIVGG